MASALSWHSPPKEKKLLDNASLQTLPVGYHCSTHLHRTMELFICLRGKLTFSVLNLTQTIQPGEYVVVFSNTPHSASVCEEDCTILQIHFHSRVLLDMLPRSTRPSSPSPLSWKSSLESGNTSRGRTPSFFSPASRESAPSSPIPRSTLTICSTSIWHS